MDRPVIEIYRRKEKGWVFFNFLFFYFSLSEMIIDITIYILYHFILKLKGSLFFFNNQVETHINNKF